MQTNTRQPFPPDVELTESRYGRMLDAQNDQYVGRSLREYGQFSEGDAEGFESQVLDGAAETIERCRPIMYVEKDREEKSAEWMQRLFGMGHRLWWHAPPLFSPEDFEANPEIVFPRVCSNNVLAMHRDQTPETDLVPSVAAGGT
jgi:hypothetical protein